LLPTAPPVERGKEQKMKLSKWTHPKTGETRIYVNGCPTFGAYDFNGRAPKVWIAAKDFNGIDDFDIVVSCKTGKNDDIINAVDEFLTEKNGGDRVHEFEKILAMA
jgi:hypothetical protein